ncbi:MAG: 3-phosphoshikimate 1-carboxyvinyltransferase [Spirochaetaceae bacterium]|nr:3-phosphoshikimate 1-carboxyvinyltransferase [Spirochaetaceae bacterium]
MNITLSKNTTEGKITIPSSKSQTIRAFLIATFAFDKSTIQNVLKSQDTLSCISACRDLGAEITNSEDSYFIDSTKVNSYNTPLEIDCGNSGTTLYLLLGLCTTLKRQITFTGDEQLQRRPIGALLSAYKELGCKVSDTNYPPFTIEGPLRGGKVSIDCPTSQYLSSLLLATPLAQENTEIITPILFEKPYVNLTISWLDKQNIKYKESNNLQHFIIENNQSYKGFEDTITGDFSSATFFFCMAAICGTSITVAGLNRFDRQGDIHTLDILEQMGCKIEWKGFEVTVSGPKELKGGTFSLNSMPDALPSLCVTAAYSKEKVIFNDTPQARLKETDRIDVMAKNLTALGVSIKELDDGIEINGNGHIVGGKVSGYGDHRIIMAMAVAALKANKKITIEGIDAVSVTFPKFFELYESLIIK